MKPTLLIAATDTNSIYLLKRYALECGVDTILAGEEGEVLSLAVQAKPAAIILEVGTSRAMGWSLLESLKSKGISQHIPVLVYSWSDEAIDAEFVTCVLRHPLLCLDFAAALEQAGILPPDASVDGFCET